MSREDGGTGRDTKEERTGWGGGEDGKAANARQKGEAARKKDVRPVQF